MYEPAGTCSVIFFRTGSSCPPERYVRLSDSQRSMMGIDKRNERAGEKLWAHLHIISTTAAIALGALASGCGVAPRRLPPPPPRRG